MDLHEAFITGLFAGLEKTAAEEHPLGPASTATRPKQPWWVQEAKDLSEAAAQARRDRRLAELDEKLRRSYHGTSPRVERRYARALARYGKHASLEDALIIGFVDELQKTAESRFSAMRRMANVARGAALQRARTLAAAEGRPISLHETAKDPDTLRRLMARARARGFKGESPSMRALVSARDPKTGDQPIRAKLRQMPSELIGRLHNVRKPEATGETSPERGVGDRIRKAIGHPSEDVRRRQLEYKQRAGSTTAPATAGSAAAAAPTPAGPAAAASSPGQQRIRKLLDRGKGILARAWNDFMAEPEKTSSELIEKIAARKWIQKAIKKPGALHKQLGVPEGKKIPASTLEAASEAPGKLGKRARLAQTLKKLRK